MLDKKQNGTNVRYPLVKPSITQIFSVNGSEGSQD